MCRRAFGAKGAGRDRDMDARGQGPDRGLCVGQEPRQEE